MIISYSLWRDILPETEKIVVLHSTFSHTVNLLLNHRLIAVVHPSRPLPPFGIRLQNEIDFKRLKTNLKLFILSKLALKNDHYIVDLTNAKIKELALKLTEKFSLSHLEVIRAGFQHSPDLITSEPGNFNYNFEKSLKDWVFNTPTDTGNSNYYLSNVTESSDTFKSLEKITKFCNHLLGWGSGSTPAGDDFLVGVLAGLCAMQIQEAPKAQKFIHYLSQRLVQPVTTRISQEFLYYALRGEFSEAIINFFTEVVKKRILHRKTLLNLLLGSSSGKDFLWGLIWVINTFSLE